MSRAPDPLRPLLHVRPELVCPGAAGDHRSPGHRVHQAAPQALTTGFLPQHRVVAVFINGEDDRTTAHYDPEAHGVSASSLTDSAGRLYGPEPVGDTEKGHWVDYVEQVAEDGPLAPQLWLEVPGRGDRHLPSWLRWLSRLRVEAGEARKQRIHHGSD